MDVHERYGILIKAELARQFKILKTYPLETINNIISFLVISVFILLGINKIGDELQMFGIIFFPSIMSLVGGISASIRSDVEIGTFEQVYNSKYSLLEISTIRSLVNVLIPFITSVLIGIIIHLFFYKLSLSLLSALIILIIAIVSSLEVGILLAGITIKFRKTDTLLNFINILILAEMVVPYFTMDAVLRVLLNIFVPFSGLIAFVQQVTINGFSTIAVQILWSTIANMLVWGMSSITVYNKCLKDARKNGSLGQY